MKGFHSWYDRQNPFIRIFLAVLIAIPFDIGASPSTWSISVSSPFLSVCLFLLSSSLLMTRILHVMPRLIR